jgi:signal transduction histidine kinase/CheY-like chemotaxis protein
VLKRPFFGLAGPWRGPNGQINGVIDIAVSPSFFRDFYAALSEQGGESKAGKVLTLVREDGQILVRYPEFAAQPPKVPHPNPFFDAIAAHPESGSFLGRSIIDRDAPQRLFAYRKVEGYPLYIAAGRSWDAMLAEWYWTMLGRLAVGVPATIALFLITRTALVRTRREHQALARANEEVVRRRLAEDALLRSQRLEAVGQMTGGIAHDNNNLLTIIVGNAELIGKRVVDDAARRLAANIGLAARRGADITQQLLAFSGKQLVRPETVNLNRRLQEFKPLLERAASEAIEVTLELDPALDPVRLDPGQFEAAILNLVGNARDAMPDGGEIVIATDNVSLSAGDAGDLPGGPYVRVVVRDQGTGMTAETAAKAFEPFFTTKDVGKGTGLGLSQVYGFARQAGGSARIATVAGRGTTVTLLLPPSHEWQAAEPTAADIVPLRAAADGEVILVVEDEPSVREMAVENLRGLGYGTLTATDAHTALALLRGPERVDVLFSDIVMPGGVNGMQLAVEAMRLRPGIRVLMTSGYAGGHVRQDLPSGVPLLMKPYDSSELSRQLRAVLNAP